MPRKARLEFAGAVYHLLDRGDRREAIFRDDRDREIFLATLGQACARTGWRTRLRNGHPPHRPVERSAEFRQIDSGIRLERTGARLSRTGCRVHPGSSSVAAIKERRFETADCFRKSDFQIAPPWSARTTSSLVEEVLDDRPETKENGRSEGWEERPGRLEARARAGNIEPDDAGESGADLHSLSSLQARDPNGFWRRSQRGDAHAARRAAGWSRGRGGQAICGAGLERFSIARSRKRESNATTFRSRTRSSTSNGSRAGNAGFIKSRTQGRSPWLEAELHVVRPKLLVCLGATAAQAILVPFRVTRERGKVLKSELAPRVLATVHPSSLLRQPDEVSREREYKHFVADLRAALNASAVR
jgi:hypothetical protein